ncbi:MAG: hypothetical protein ACI9UU_001188 [Candidatus Azotimanducaceae bacterium]|jgi:hypothetical protein
MTNEKFKITFGQLRAAGRINSTRHHLKNHNYFPTEYSEKAEFYRALAGSIRTLDGSANDPSQPRMGMVGRAFSRNTPPEARSEDSRLDDPDPRLVSKNLLHNSGRQTLAPGINLLAAGWIQFQVHDWFDHKTDANKDIQLPTTNDLDALTVAATEEITDGNSKPRYANTQGHWWDGSQLYGNSLTIAKNLRRKADKLTCAELDMTECTGEELLPTTEKQKRRTEQSGFTNNWWLGLSIFHTLFAREHNQIVKVLRSAGEANEIKDPQAHEDWLFDKARLINSALMAKVHTLEWTTAILDHPVMKLGLYADWWGKGAENAGALFNVFAGYAAKEKKAYEDQLTVEDLETIKEGIPAFSDLIDVVINIFQNGVLPHRATPSEFELGSDHQSLEYAMSEEFVAVYRMHPLLPEEVTLKDADGQSVDYSLEDISFDKTRDVLEAIGLDQALLSFASQSPGALRLRNFPRALTDLKLPDVEGSTDLGAIDILRDRERGIPRYAAFRRHITRQTGPELKDGPTQEINSFADICGDPNEAGIDGVEQARRKADAQLLASVYNSPEDVDLQIGMLTEPLPAGFGFSWTAFEVFLLMAIFRLSRDRFFTYDYRAEVYTKTGINWIDESNLSKVIERNTEIKLSDVLFPDPDDGMPANLFTLESWK